MSTATLLAELNEFRASDGLAPLTSWKVARNMPQLEAYRAIAASHGLVTDTIEPMGADEADKVAAELEAEGLTNDLPFANILTVDQVADRENDGPTDAELAMLPDTPVVTAPVAPAAAKPAKAMSKKLSAYHLIARQEGASLEDISKSLGISVVAARSLIGDLRRDGQNIVSKGKGVFGTR